MIQESSKDKKFQLYRNECKHNQGFLRISLQIYLYWGVNKLTNAMIQVEEST